MPSKALVLVGSGPEDPEPYTLGTQAQTTILLSQAEGVESKEGWFYFDLDADASFQLDSDCGFALQLGVEFQIIDTSNNAVRNLSCDPMFPSIFDLTAGMYAIRVFSDNANNFEVTPRFTLTERPA